jgi:secondary thiamine-phosphate synthase enzyme
MAEILTVSTKHARECIDLTAQVAEIVRRSAVRRGLCQVHSLHTTASIVVNENADPNIGVDLLTALDRAVPRRAGWLHDRIDDNAHAHVKASLLGPSELVPVRGGELLLGTWQGIWLFEFDGPRTRQVAVHLIGG